MKHQSTIDGTGIWLPGIASARQHQREGAGRVLYLFTTVRGALTNQPEMLLIAPLIPYAGHVIIPMGGDPTYVYGQDSKLPPYEIRLADLP